MPYYDPDVETNFYKLHPEMKPWVRVNIDTERMEVPGGWIYRRIGSYHAPSMVFVPEVQTIAIEEAPIHVFASGVR